VPFHSTRPSGLVAVVMSAAFASLKPDLRSLRTPSKRLTLSR
jgi:hypothetical protein